jgi:hypothetical protein
LMGFPALVRKQGSGIRPACAYDTTQAQSGQQFCVNENDEKAISSIHGGTQGSPGRQKAIAFSSMSW